MALFVSSAAGDSTLKWTEASFPDDSAHHLLLEIVQHVHCHAEFSRRISLFCYPLVTDSAADSVKLDENEPHSDLSPRKTEEFTKALPFTESTNKRDLLLDFQYCFMNSQKVESRKASSVKFDFVRCILI